MALEKTPLCNFGEKAQDFNLKNIDESPDRNRAKTKLTCLEKTKEKTEEQIANIKY